MFLLGQILHLATVKVPSLRAKSRTNNHKFNFMEWLKEDWNLILATNVLGGLLLIGLDEFFNWKPELEDFAKWLFAFVGTFGSSLAMRLSSYEKKIMEFLDIKANISDKLVGKTTGMQDLINKGSDAVGNDVTISPDKYGK